MTSKLRNPKPTFNPSTGLMPHGTVKQQLQALLDSGFFDETNSLIFASATATNYRAHHMGTTWDCMALSVALNAYIQEELNG